MAKFRMVDPIALLRRMLSIPKWVKYICIYIYIHIYYYTWINHSVCYQGEVFELCPDLCDVCTYTIVPKRWRNVNSCKFLLMFDDDPAYKTVLSFCNTYKYWFRHSYLHRISGNKSRSIVLASGYHLARPLTSKKWGEKPPKSMTSMMIPSQVKYVDSMVELCFWMAFSWQCQARGAPAVDVAYGRFIVRLGCDIR